MTKSTVENPSSIKEAEEDKNMTDANFDVLTCASASVAIFHLWWPMVASYTVVSAACEILRIYIVKLI